MIDKATVRKILDAADIVEVVGDYVNLTRRGANYIGLCPFHNERTPSFSVSPARGICHCFSCGKGGSPVNFIMEKEGINFHDALLHLARKYGIKVEERQLTDAERAEQSKRESMLVVNEWAMHEFEHGLHNSQEGKDIGLSYLYQRGVTQAAIEKFHIGYALDKPSAMFEKAIRQGFEEETLMEVGLCGKSNRDGRPYDRLRGRVIFPILSPAGKVIAFGGRGIKGEPAKYINSPESLIYRKSNELYGIYQAKNAIVRQKKCFLVEGYMDVIGMWQSGMENTVASSGTSLTDGQIALIHRFTENVTLIYDGDAAGIKASLRGIDLLLSHKMNIKVLLLPDGEDPDSFARKHSPEEFRAYIEKNEEDFISFKTKTLMSSQNGSTVERAEAVKSIVTSLASIPDMVKRSMYIQETAHIMNVSERILTLEVGKALVEVAARMKQRQQLNRIEYERRQTTTPQTVTSPHTTAQPQPSATPQATETIDRRLLTNKTVTNPLEGVERNVIEYVIKYGMLSFCEASKSEDEPAEWLNVAEYVREEIHDDGISFSTPLYKRTFDRILDMTEAYRIEEAEVYARILEQQKSDHDKWCDSLAEQGLTIPEIEDKEKEYAEQCKLQSHEAIQKFAADYIGRELGSDQDDDMRHLVLNVITPRYILSKYHSKNVHLETEQERIEDLIPRAIYEWKDALLLEQYKEVQEQLRRASASGETANIEELLLRLKQIADLRCRVAKSIGERILTPRK